MARTAKKERILMPEEKLAQALVPDEDGTNSIPDNWEWIKLQAISQIRTGKKDANYGTPDGQYFFFTCAAEPIRCDGYSFEGKAILLAGNGDISNISIYEGKFEAYQRTYVLNIIPSLNTEFVYYYFKYRWVDYNIDKMFGTAIPYIRLGNLQEFPIPLAPFAEQQRIVDRIESLFAKLDEAKEKALAVVDGFEDRKAAILHKAFAGELTAEWRKQKGIPCTSWKQLTVKDVCKDVKVGIVIKPSQYYTDEKSGTAAFRSANVREFHIDDFDWVYLNEAGMIINQRSVVHTGDVLVVRSGNPGTACVVDERFDGYNAIDILIAVPNKAIIMPDYLCAFTNSPMGRNLVAESKRGMALAHFNVSGYSKLELPLPTIEEQSVIVSTLFTLLEKEEQARETAEQVIDQIDTMKKSILARAFRGELGTNDPTDESAEVMLKRML